MKTTKKYTVLSLILIFAAANSLFALGGVTTTRSGKNIGKIITYVVNIEHAQNFSGNGHIYNIIMTDGTGLQIAPSQTLRPGVWTYTFFETGDVRGTRVARMILEPLGPGSNAIAPSSKTGTFWGGQTYQFLLIPNPHALETGKGSE